MKSHNDNGENPNFNPGDPNFYLDDRIIFNIPGATPAVIHIINGPLPAIIDMLHIDGTTQPGYSGTPVIVYILACSLSTNNYPEDISESA